MERVDPNIQTTKREKLPPKITGPAKLSFRYKGEIKTFSDQQKLREFTIGRHRL